MRLKVGSLYAHQYTRDPMLEAIWKIRYKPRVQQLLSQMLCLIKARRALIDDKKISIRSRMERITIWLNFICINRVVIVKHQKHLNIFWSSHWDGSKFCSYQPKQERHNTWDNAEIVRSDKKRTYKTICYLKETQFKYKDKDMLKMNPMCTNGKTISQLYCYQINRFQNKKPYEDKQTYSQQLRV